MKSSLVKSFTNTTFDTNLTVIMIGDQIWFIAKEVAATLDYSTTNRGLQSVKEKYKRMLNFNECKEIFSGYQNGIPKINSNGMYLINKSGLIQLVLKPEKP